MNKNEKEEMKIMPAFDTCGCCSLRSGVIILGLTLTLITMTLAMIPIYLLIHPDLGEFLEESWRKIYVLNGGLISFKESNSTEGFHPLNINEWQIFKIEMLLAVATVILVMCWLSNCLLIAAAIKKFPPLLVQWIIMQWIAILSVIICFGIILWKLISIDMTGKFWWLLMCLIAVLILLVLALLVVMSFYQILRDREIPIQNDNVELLNRHLWIPKPYTNAYYD